MSYKINPSEIAVPHRNIYSHAVRVEAGTRQLWISGQLGITADGITAPSFRSQCETLLNNMQIILAADGLQVEDLIKMNAYIVSGQELAIFSEVRSIFLAGARPAMTTLFVAALAAPEWLIEVDAVAAR